MWTKAHVLAKHILSGQVSRVNAFGNECADRLAKAGASISAIDRNQELSLSHIEGRVYLIRCRLVAVQKCALIRRGQNKDTCDWHDNLSKEHLQPQAT